MANLHRYLGFILGFAFIAACVPLFDQGETDDDDDGEAMSADLELARAADVVRATSLGAAEVTTSDGLPVPVIHVRLTVANRFDRRPWRIDAAGATLAVAGDAETGVMFINSDLATLPIALVEKQQVRVLDFYFPYPRGFDLADPGELDFRVGIHTPRRDLAWSARVIPVAAGGADTRAAGWGATWWADPAYPWTQFNRRPGRKTHKVPSHAAVTEPPRWPPTAIAGEPVRFAVHNQSSRSLAELRLSPVAEHAWEPSLVRPLAPGRGEAVPPIACMRYDVMVVDGRGRRCVLPMMHLCFGSEPWVIDDVTLEQCEWTR